VIQTPKEAEQVKMVPEVPQSTVIETLKEAEPVDLTHEVVAKSTIVEAAKEAEQVKMVPEVPQSTAVETTIKAESNYVGEIKIKRARREGKKPLLKTRDRGYKIFDLEGVGPVYTEKLNSIGIYTTSDLLESGATPHGRQELAEKTGISHKLILEWVNLSDLFRIKGIGEEYSDLLEEAGVDTVVELSRRNAINLHTKILEVNEAKKLVRRTPSQAMVESWIRGAKDLPRKIEY